MAGSPAARAPRQDFPAEEYVGSAVVSAAEADDVAVEVEVRLRGHFEPLDGRFHWYGRIAAHSGLRERYRSGALVVLTTPHGQAAGRLSDVDPWGRFRITGSGQPPF